MLVSAKEMLEKARDGKYAVGQFNINNLEWTKSILLTAQEMNSPVILGVSCGAGKYMTGFKTVASMVSAMIDDLKITVPVALHLDHGTYEACFDCIDAGFSSIMFDGSHYPIDENIEKTKELVSICKEKGLSLEAEVGSIGGEEDGVVVFMGFSKYLTAKKNFNLFYDQRDSVNIDKAANQKNKNAGIIMMAAGLMFLIISFFVI